MRNLEYSTPLLALLRCVMWRALYGRFLHVHGNLHLLMYHNFVWSPTHELFAAGVQVLLYSG